MVSDTPNFLDLIDNDASPSNMTADKHEPDLFVCDVADAALKDLIPAMEHPFYSLSKKPVTVERVYERGDLWLKIVPSSKGMATIYDKDILIYAVSQVIASMKAGQEPQQRVRINCHDFLQFTNRGTGGKDYNAICDAIERLDGTRIRTNIRTGDEEQFDAFGLIEGGTVRRKYGLKGRLLWVEIKLSDFVFNAIRHKEVLTLHRDYFKLAKPIERRVYELARKHCGQQSQWKASVQTLFDKSGSTAPVKGFRNSVKTICTVNNMPDYDLTYLADSDQVLFINKKTMPLDRDRVDQEANEVLLRLSADIGDDARQIVIGWDLRVVKDAFAKWWVNKGKPPTTNADSLFLSFCRTFYEKNGRP